MSFSKSTEAGDDTGLADSGLADTGVGDATVDSSGSGDAGGSGDTSEASGDASALPVCPDGTELPNPYTPAGCGYAVTQPGGVTDIRRSCGTPGPDAAPQYVHIAFASDHAEHDVSVNWLTGEQTRLSVVRVGTSPDALTQTFEGVSFAVAGVDRKRVVHEAHLCGLTPATRYYYKVDGEDPATAPGSFVTAPERNATTPFTFVFSGDTRNVAGDPLWGQALSAIATNIAPDFMVFSGDAVLLGSIQMQWDAWFTASAGPLRNIPFMPVNGNHDFLSLQYQTEFTLPGNEANYFFRYGNVLFIMLNDYPETDATMLDNGARFLRQTISDNPDAQWRVLVNHRPFYSSALNHGSAADLQGSWLPIIDELGVDLVINGHDHNYERSKPIRNGSIDTSGRGTVYVISAGLGAELYDNGSNWWTELSEKRETYCKVNVSGGTMDVTALRVDGTTADHFVLTK